MYFWEDIFGPVVVVFGLLILFFALILGIAIPATSYQCSKYEEVTGRPTKMAGGSCYIYEDNKWFMWEEYKLRFATKGKE